MSTNQFLSGVVEGFYGRPWTSDQRRELYSRMHDMGMNAYVYAPKDDLKHRAEWRQLYTPEEADHLRNLIVKCEEESVSFVYALSPGIDMIYSSTKEQQFVKQKLQQVQSLGCKAFALLFDDIEPCMCDTDKKHFASFAYAQIAVTNATYEYLGGPPLFMFCPTGPRVISRNITEEHCKKVAKVMGRKPLIWDNLHANDYDTRRIFLGPYSGRGLSIRPFIAGVLTNPNCEFESNFIAMYTLAMWSVADSQPQKQGSDVILEAGDENSVAVELTRLAAPTKLYHPSQCLGEALQCWLPHLNGTKSRVPRAGFGNASMAVGDSSVQGINTCGVITTTTQTSMSSVLFHSQMAASDINSQPPIYTPSPSVFSGTTDDGTVVSTNEDPLLTAAMVAVNSLSDGYSEPMELAQSQNVNSDKQIPKCNLEEQMEGEECSAEDSSKEMQVDEGVEVTNECLEEEVGISWSDLRDISDLFYLPFEHGSRGNWLISEFAWLTSNAPSVSEAKRNGNKTATNEWMSRADEFVTFSGHLTGIYMKMFYCKNRQFIYDMYPYIWDVRDTVALLAAYVLWLKMSNGPSQQINIGPDIVPIIQRSVSAIENEDQDSEPNSMDKLRWPKDNESMSSMGQESEPWVHRGGLVGELLRLFPLAGVDVFPCRPAVPPCPKCYTVRPYCDEDKGQVYAISRLTFDDLSDASERFIMFPDLIGDRTVGSFLSFCPYDCFVVEETSCDWMDQPSTNHKRSQVVAFACAAQDAQKFLKYCNEQYFPMIKMKYLNEQVKELIDELHTFSGLVPDYLSSNQSLVHIRCMQSVLESSALHRLTAATLAAAKSTGSNGAYSEVRLCDRSVIEMYSKVGFFETVPSDSCPDTAVTVLARSF